MRYRIVALLSAVMLLLTAALPVAARQVATPASDLAGLGLPTLDVTAANSEFTGIPEELPAGRYLVTLTVADDVEFGAAIDFIQPVGATIDEALALISGMAGGEAVSAGTPAAGAGAEEMGGLPPWVADATFAGGIGATSGETAQVVLDLTPGEWIAWGDDPSAPQSPVVFTVTGEMPAELPLPDAGATLTMTEFAIEVTAGELAAGPQVIQLENDGGQPHFLYIARGPDDMTAEQVGVVLDEEMAAEMSGTPPAYSDLNPDEDLGLGVITGTQSNGTAIWLPVDLEAGAYVMLCFFPDVGDGIPHAYKGMYAVVTVGE